MGQPELGLMARNKTTYKKRYVTKLFALRANALYESGFTLEQVARKLGCSKRFVRQCVVSRPHGGSAPRGSISLKNEMWSLDYTHSSPMGKQHSYHQWTPGGHRIEREMHDRIADPNPDPCEALILKEESLYDTKH